MTKMTKNITITVIILVVGIVLFLVVRIDTNKTKISDTALKLPFLPADSEVSTSGICADVNQKTNNVVVIIHEDGPSPRCQQINADQFITIQNDTEKDLNFSLGQNGLFSSIIFAHNKYTFSVPIGEMLAFGVHKITLDQMPYAGPELWLIGDKNVSVLRKRAESGENGGFCAHVITRARNIITGEEMDFPTPCDVPVGWERAL